MSFSAANKDAIAGYLGYSITSENQTLIDAATDLMESLSADGETRVKAYLTALGTIDTEIATARVTVGSAVSQLQSQGRRYISQVSIALNLQVRKDYYS